MSFVSETEFEQEVACVYEGESYSVRDNGAVLRHSREGKRRRALDDQWTFGRENSANPYLCIAGVRIHRIVATAFHGDPPDAKYVVDHIDSNCRNNRPENLRWLTRIENSLKNPATRKKIEYLCGSIEAFLENPSMLNDIQRDRNFGWMRAVTREEAAASRERMDNWAKSTARPRGGSIGEWLFASGDYASQQSPVAVDVESLTPGAFQRNWKTPCEFPAAPEIPGEKSLAEYKEQLTEGAVFSQNGYGGWSRVLSADINQAESALIVLCELGPDPVKPWAISKVTIEGNELCHENLGSCFARDGAEKRYCEALGLVWEGGDSIDDYC